MALDYDFRMTILLLLVALFYLLVSLLRAWVNLLNLRHAQGAEVPAEFTAIVDAEKFPESRKLANVTNLPTFASFKNGVLVNQVQTNKELTWCASQQSGELTFLI